ncbi:hypothetical protein [Candidatus Marithrix sp. Canyon 246]|uniref:hypothetical protein n=1 Tax=Candidatus Marithrix sp. Canyon 246 TaxID=1827136 RepID=UPI00084A1939|nr:hypothetical protein [Candidatus Marithrix sp. Canyon 246]
MNQNEVYNLLNTYDLTVVFDTNALFSNQRFIKLCNNINRIKDYDNKYQFNLVIPAPAHAEKLHDLKQQYQEHYNSNEIMKGLTDKGITIASFEPHHADVVANLVGKQFATTQAWRRFKRNRCIACLGLNTNTQGSGKTCGATIDWLIAAYAEAEGCVLVTGDTREEFKNIRKTTLEDLEAAVDQFINYLNLK